MIFGIGYPYIPQNAAGNNTDYFLFGGLWYEGDALTSKPYGKFGGRLTKGMYPNIEVVGNIANPQDYKKYKEKEKI